MLGCPNTCPGLPYHTDLGNASFRVAIVITDKRRDRMPVLSPYGFRPVQVEIQPAQPDAGRQACHQIAFSTRKQYGLLASRSRLWPRYRPVNESVPPARG